MKRHKKHKTRSLCLLSFFVSINGFTALEGV